MGDRLYTIFPGTNDSGDGAASFSIVNLNTLEVLNTLSGAELSSGYPNIIQVFGYLITN